MEKLERKKFNVLLALAEAIIPERDGDDAFFTLHLKVLGYSNQQSMDFRRLSTSKPSAQAFEYDAHSCIR